MKIIEIRNNLVKVDFEVEEGLALGRFIAITSSGLSYVAQIVNLKTDGIHQNAIAKLLFTFSKDGVVNNYDGTLPNITSNVSILKSQELLDLLPVETPLYIGRLAQEDAVLKIDLSVFEHNFTVFSDHDDEKKTFISNMVSQLSRMNEKSIIFDTNNIFSNFPKVVVGLDFKIPFNSEMIDYIYDYELSDMNVQTKAVIKDIFYAVQKYIDSTLDKFIPIDRFVEVVNVQYQQNHAPELALLVNKLQKYKDLQIFANSKEELQLFSGLLEENNALIIDLLDVNSKLQNKIISSVYGFMNYINHYAYVFLPVTDDNSDKKLLRKVINNGHIFTLIFANHSYKYALELKEQAQNIAFFAPQTVQHEFAVYNTFLNKLNHDEFVIYGKLTHNVPFIVESEVLEDEESPVVALEQDVEDAEDYNNQVAGSDDTQAVEEELNYAENNIFEHEPEQLLNQENTNEEYKEPVENFSGTSITEINENIEQEEPEDGQPLEIYHSSQTSSEPQNHIENILAEDDFAIEEDSVNDSLSANVIDENFIQDSDSENGESDDIDDMFEDLQNVSEVETSSQDEILTDEDLDFIDENMEEGNSFEPDVSEDSLVDSAESAEDIVENDDAPVVVPVYPAEGVDSSQKPEEESYFAPGDIVSHPRYGNGTVEKIIKYGNKTLCSVLFDNVGRRLLDPSISDFDKIQ